MTKKAHPTILFMGSPGFASDILAALHEAKFPIVGVIAQPDKMAGRGLKMHSPEVAVYAKDKGLPLFQPSTLKDPVVLDALKKMQPDLIVVAAYGKLLPDTILRIPKIDCLNVHASLLPEYRGASPINYALLDGKTKTGVSIMRMVKELDAGPVYTSEPITIDVTDDAITLTKKLSMLGAELLTKTIDAILNKGLKPTDQDHTCATYAPKLTRELSHIDWTQSAEKIFNQIRALVPWPVASMKLSDHFIKIFSATVLPERSNHPPGTIVHIARAGWTVATGTTDILVTDVQMEGRARMKAFDLANGLRLAAGITF